MDRTQTLSQAEQAFKTEDYITAIRILSSYPQDDSEILFNKAIAESLVKQFDVAFADMKKALKLNPTGPGIALGLGNIAALMGDNEAAYGWYQQALKIREDAPQAQAKIDAIVPALEAEAKKGALRFVESDKTFADVVGMKDVKEKLKEHVLLPIEIPELYKKYNKKVGVGMILYGGPGTGKSFMAKALAGEAKPKIRMASIRINQVLNMYVGNSEKNMHKIFEEARRNAPCILFFDEFEALGKARAGSTDKASDAGTTSKVVDQLLTEMDGVETNLKNIFVIGATNLPWEVDSALRRKGRFGEAFYIAPPNYKDRVALFKLYTKGMPLLSINYGRLARATMGFSQSDIATICDYATLEPLLKEHETKKSGFVTTGALLRQIKKERSTLDIWYPEVRKTVIGTVKTEISGGKKVVTGTTGKLDADEKKLFREMIADVVNNTKPSSVFFKKLMRWIALHVA